MIFFSSFLNTAEIAPFVSGSNLTFFVPTDAAFERLGLDILPDDILGSQMGVKLLLNHFVKGRLYDRDLKDGVEFETVGGEVLKIHRRSDSNVTVNQANIIESEMFVYNLGTMFYVDDVLYSNYLLGNPPATTTTTTATIRSSATTAADAELVPSNEMVVTKPSVVVVTEEGEDFLMDEDEIITPRALPVLVNLVKKQEGN